MFCGSCEDIALKRGRSGKVEAIRMCGALVKVLEVRMATDAFEDEMRQEARASMVLKNENKKDSALPLGAIGLGWKTASCCDTDGSDVGNEGRSTPYMS